MYCVPITSLFERNYIFIKNLLHFSSLATISPSSCLLPFQSFNPLFLRPFFLFFGFPFWFPLRIFFTFPVFPLPFPCAYARVLALLTRV